MNITSLVFSKTFFAFFFSAITFLSAHSPPLKVMYQADKVYKELGLKVPDLSSEVIAIVGGKEFSLKYYKLWLYAKVGLNPETIQAYRHDKLLGEMLRERKVNVQADKEQLLENLYLIASIGQLIKTPEQWENRCAELEIKGPPDEPPFLVKTRFYQAYLVTLYVKSNWAEIRMFLEKQSSVDADHLDTDIFQINEKDAGVKNLIRLSNAYYIASRYYTYVDAYIKKKFDSIAAKAIAEERGSYIEWVYDRSHSPLFVENYISMYLIEQRAKEMKVVISPTEFSELFTKRANEYRQSVDDFNRRNPKIATPLNYSPDRLDQISHESRVDLLGSRIYRLNYPIKPFELKKKFYDRYGYMGEKCEVYEIFKWIRKRSKPEADNAYNEYMKKTESDLRQELEEIRKKVLADKRGEFPYHAIFENNNPFYQKNCGYWGKVDEAMGVEFKAEVDKLKKGEISQVLKSNLGLHILWYAGEKDNLPYYYHISRQLSYGRPFDVKGYEAGIEEDRVLLLELKKQIEAGEDFEELARQHSDSYKRFGVDMSELYQKRYGFAYARELSNMNSGEMKIISTRDGNHLAWLREREVTALNDEIKNEIVHEYNFTLATNGDLNDLSRDLLYATNPYFSGN